VAHSQARDQYSPKHAKAATRAQPPPRVHHRILDAAARCRRRRFQLFSIRSPFSHQHTATAALCGPSQERAAFATEPEGNRRREAWIQPPAPTMSSRTRPPWLKKLKRIIGRRLRSGSLTPEAASLLCDEVHPSIQRRSPQPAVSAAADVWRADGRPSWELERFI